MPTKSKINKIPPVKTKLTPKQKGFCDTYIDTKNATESAMQNYKVSNRNSANSIGSENLAKLGVQEYLESIAEDASSRIEELSRTARNETTKLNANKDILDRAGYKPIDKQEITLKPEPIIKLKHKELKE